MNLNIDDLDTNKLDLGGHYYGVIYFITDQLDRNKEVSDDMLSWIVNPPPIYAAVESDEIKEAMKNHAKYYQANQEKSLKLVRLLKKEFYDFMCTESEYYAKERALIGGDINLLITGVAAAIVTKMSSVEMGIVTSFIATFITIVGKMGNKVMCESFKPKGEWWSPQLAILK